MKRRKFGSAGHYSPHVDWQNDIDYADKLSPEERELLEQFLDEFYFSRSRPTLQSADQLRERWRAYKANQRDVMGRGAAYLEDLFVFTNEIHENGSERAAISYEPPDQESAEDTLIDQIDAKRARERAAEAAEVEIRMMAWHGLLTELPKTFKKHPFARRKPYAGVLVSLPKATKKR